MGVSNQSGSEDLDATPLDLEPAVAAVLARTLSKRAQGPYKAMSDAAVGAGLERLFTAHGRNDVSIDRLGRLAGGASKEMFEFVLSDASDAEPEHLVLRMDPLESVVETSRQREAEAIAAMQGTVPVPRVRYLDQSGEHLGQSGVVTTFVGGVTRPATSGGSGVSGIGTDYGNAAARIAPQFIDNLVAIHAFDWRGAALPSFGTPDAYPEQAALWQVNWYEQVWRQDAQEEIPIASLVRQWLRDNAPPARELCFVHADYRMGNFMFDPDSGEMTAVLDWELAHVGDFHEDLAYVTQRLFGRVDDDGTFLCCGLFPREDFLRRYQARSGRTIDRDTLHFYEVLNAWKSVVHTFATCQRAAAAGNNHKDILLSWLTPVGHILVNEIVTYLSGRTRS